MFRRIELPVYCLMAVLAAPFCLFGHHCSCGHLAHDRHIEVLPWIVDGTWLFGLSAAAVVGLRGRGRLERTTGIACALMLAVMLAMRETLPMAVLAVLAALLPIHAMRRAGRGGMPVPR